MAGTEEDVGMILKELTEIKKELRYIKEHMIDIDSILTSDEEYLLNIAKNEYHEGKTIPLDDAKRNLLCL